MFEDIRISYLVDKYSPASGAFSPRPEALDSVEAQPRTLCIGSKSRARNDCIDLPPRSKYFIYLHISNANVAIEIIREIKA